MDDNSETSNENGCVNNSDATHSQDDSPQSSQNHKPWRLSGDKHKDDLKLFRTGSFYDCTFKVSNDATGEIKLFRCHKVYLASCSEAFDKMLCGPFKEAQVDRDFEICITKTSPEVFDLAMSYVYGRCVDFKGPDLAVQVYLFAHQWMILHLMEAVEHYLLVFIGPEDGLRILEHFVDEEENYIRSKCLDVIEDFTERVLKSDSWVVASKEVVLEVLRLNSLQMDEATLFQYLVKWGRTGTKDDDEARSKIDDGLKLIKFCAMSRKSFTNLCCSPLPLSMEEKFKILLSITGRNSDLLPEGFSVLKWPRFLINSGENDAVCKWSTFDATNCTVDADTPPFTLKVSIDTPRYLIGLMLTSLTGINFDEWVRLKCEIFSPEQGSVPVASANFDDQIDDETTCVIELNWPVLMHPGILYSIRLSYQHQLQRETQIFDSLGSTNLVSVNDGDTISVHLECENDSILDIFGLTFGKDLV